MEFGILGPLEVRREGKIIDLPRRKHRALLAALLLRVGETVSADRLIEELWGERPPRTAKDALQNYVSLLRKTLGEEILVTRDAGYVLDIRPEQIDIARFERLAAEARTIETAEARAAKLRAALGLWRGPPLADIAYEPFAAIEIARLEELRLAATEELIDAELELGRDGDLVAELEALIKEHPYDERLRGQLMLALYRAGRQAEALEAYQAARHLLVDELGLEPGPPLRELEQAILRHDAALGGRAALPPTVSPSRRTVTVVFADLVDSTALVEELDPEALRELLDRYFAAVRTAVERHGGVVEKFIGDAVMVVFGIPQAHEDDALRAVRAAVELRDSLGDLDERLEVRVGVNTGEVFAGSPGGADVLVTGATVNLAKRLEQAAPAGGILVGASTLRLVRDAVKARRVKGDPVRFRLLDVVEGALPLARRFDAPLVGREAELRELRRAFQTARDEPRCVVFTLLGDAGIGKTRLARELVASLRDDATVLVGRCVSYGEGATYLPLAEMIGPGFGALVESAGSTGEIFLAVRRRFEEFAAERPLLLAFEDVHWAEPTLLDLIEYLGAQTTGSPILALCLSRPDLLAERAAWAEVGPSLVLEPLPDEQARELLGSVSDPEVSERIVEIAEGNPLYVEQLLAYVEEGGAGALDAVPGSIEALLTSRLDRLGPDERAVAQRAAVVGRRFSPAAVAALGSFEALPGLERAGFVHPAGELYRFHHVLVRDVVYAGTPKAERAELHQRRADWLDGQPDGSDELIGYHLEQAAGYRRELGAPEQQVERLAANAGRRLGAAGIRTWKRGDATTTINLLGRATALLPEHDSERLELMCELGGALRMAGDLPRTERVLAEAREAATTDRRIALRAQLELAYMRRFTDMGERADELLEVAAAAIPVFHAHGDDRSLGRAWFVSASTRGPLQCRYTLAEEDVRSALLHYRRSGWPAAACLGNLAATLYYGPTPVGKALRECQTLLVDPDLNAEANILPFIAGLEAMRGKFERARDLLGRATSIYRELGQAGQAEYSCGAVASEVELLAGDEGAAEEELRASCTALERIGDHAYLATRAAALADVLAGQWRDEEADRWTELCERYMIGDDMHSQVPCRGVRAKLLARRGRHAEAEALAYEAVGLADGIDALGIRAKASLDLAEVLRLSGRVIEASDAMATALSLLEQKGNAVTAERARSVFSDLVAAQ